jgi:hypothetical protein
MMQNYQSRSMRFDGQNYFSYRPHSLMQTDTRVLLYLMEW